MKTYPKTVSTVAAANFLCFWIAYGLLVAAWPQAGLSQFVGFAYTPPPSHLLGFLLWTFVILGAPTSIILDGVNGEHFMLLQVLSSILNCTIWGLCLGFPIYAVSKRLRNV